MVNESESPPRGPTLPDVAFIAVLGLTYLVLAVATVSDYGVMWDCNEMFAGDRNARFYRTFDLEYLDYSIPKPVPEYARPGHPDFDAISRAARINPPLQFPHHIWPVGPTSSSFTKMFFYSGLGWVGPIEGHHLAPILWFVLLLVAFFFFVRREVGRVPAMIAVIALATYPRLIAHSHFNLKDVPSLAIFSMVIFTFFRAVTGRSWRWLVASAVLWGVALATKANGLFLPVILAPWSLAVGLRRRREGKAMLSGPEWAALAAYPAIGIAMTVVLWPYLWLDFPEHLRAHVEHLLWGYGGGVNRVQLEPVRDALITMPLVVLGLALAGVPAFLRDPRSRDARHLGLLLALWLAIPVLRKSMPGARHFDVLRHWIEFIPPVCVMAGVGGQALLKWLDGRRARVGIPARWRTLVTVFVIALLFTPVVLWSVRNHPHQLVFYNGLIGGLGGAQLRGLPDSTDYWGVSTRSGMRWLNENAEAGAALFTPLGHQHVAFTREAWLRSDLRFIDSESLTEEEAAREVQEYRGVIYVMYFTRRIYYGQFIPLLEEHVEPVRTIEVDGGVILKIYRFEKDVGPLFRLSQADPVEPGTPGPDGG